jgi:spore coat polysaccharide biosynthesis protein SpsF (cytidylyltransferase family)
VAAEADVSDARTVIVVQARMSSTRLPGKVLMPLAGAPALARILDRLRRVPRAHEVVVATSDEGSDDPVAREAVRSGARVVRGSLTDVLGRYHAAATAAGADVVVRITGDCPLVDPTVIDDVVERFFAEREHVDYCSNVDERTYPDGLDVEVFSMAALHAAHAGARTSYEREHVTPYVRRRCRKVSVVQDVDLSALRWTLDTADDLAFIRAVYDEYGADDAFTSSAVYRLLRARPELIRVGAGAAPTADERASLLARIDEHLSREHLA